MPKILINEQDFTTPGTPGNYANFAVLITGFAGEVSDPIVKPDNNNAYEFKSAQTFKDTIGLVAPSMTKSTSDGGFITIKHYGNQMAYELLKLGYPIIYKSLGNLDEDYTSAKEVIDTITSENLWEPFKDKASYDFRFVTHGLLASTADSLDELLCWVSFLKPWNCWTKTCLCGASSVCLSLPAQRHTDRKPVCWGTKPVIK